MAVINHSNFDLENEKTALEFVLYYRLKRENTDSGETDYAGARKYVADLSPQMQGKLRKEIQKEAEQVLSEMQEVRNWQVNLDRLRRMSSTTSLNMKTRWNHRSSGTWRP